MKIYDKIAWHTDAGENLEACIKRFKLVFEHLKEKDMLSEEGRELIDIGIDESSSLHSRLLNDNGNKFCEENQMLLVGVEAETLQILLDAVSYAEYKNYVEIIYSQLLGNSKYSKEDMLSLSDKIYVDRQSLPNEELDRKKVLKSLQSIIDNIIDII